MCGSPFYGRGLFITKDAHFGEKLRCLASAMGFAQKVAELTPCRRAARRAALPLCEGETRAKRARGLVRPILRAHFVNGGTPIGRTGGAESPNLENVNSAGSQTVEQSAILRVGQHAN